MKSRHGLQNGKRFSAGRSDNKVEFFIQKKISECRRKLIVCKVKKVFKQTRRIRAIHTSAPTVLYFPQRSCG